MRTDGDARVLPLSDRTDGIRVDENGTVTLPDGTVLRYYRVGDLKNSGAFGLRGKNTGDLSTLSDASSMVSCMATLRDILVRRQPARGQRRAGGGTLPADY